MGNPLQTGKSVNKQYSYSLATFYDQNLFITHVSDSDDDFALQVMIKIVKIHSDAVLGTKNSFPSLY